MDPMEKYNFDEKTYDDITALRSRTSVLVQKPFPKIATVQPVLVTKKRDLEGPLSLAVTPWWSDDDVTFDVAQPTRGYSAHCIGSFGNLSTINVPATSLMATHVSVTYRNAADWDTHRLALYPSIGPASATLIDRNVMAASESLNILFPLASAKLSLAASDRGIITSLAAKSYCPTRFLWRLASLWVGAAMAEALGTKLIFGGGVRQGAVVHLTNAQDYHALLGTAALTDNFAPLTLMHCNDPEGVATAIMAAATCGRPNLQFANGAAVPAVLNSVPSIPHLRALLLTGVTPTAANFNALTAAQIWEVVATWAAQYASHEALLEIIDAILVYCYGADAHTAFPAAANQFSIALPPPKMAALLLGPLSTRICDWGESRAELEQPKLHVVAARAALRGQVLACAVRQHVWTRGADMPMFMQHQLSRALLRECSSAGSTVSMMVAAEEIAHSLGIVGNVGRIIGTTSMTNFTHTRMITWLSHTARHLQWDAVLPVVGTVPQNCGIAGCVNPAIIPPTEAIEVGHWYTPKALAPGATPMGLLATIIATAPNATAIEYGVEIYCVTTGRLMRTPRPLDRTAWLTLSSWGFAEPMALDDLRMRPVLRFTTPQAVMHMRRSCLSLRSATWYIDVPSIPEAEPLYTRAVPFFTSGFPTTPTSIAPAAPPNPYPNGEHKYDDDTDEAEKSPPTTGYTAPPRNATNADIVAPAHVPPPPPRPSPLSAKQVRAETLRKLLPENHNWRTLVDSVVAHCTRAEPPIGTRMPIPYNWDGDALAAITRRTFIDETKSVARENRAAALGHVASLIEYACEFSRAPSRRAELLHFQHVARNMAAALRDEPSLTVDELKLSAPSIYSAPDDKTQEKQEEAVRDLFNDAAVVSTVLATGTPLRDAVINLVDPNSHKFYTGPQYKAAADRNSRIIADAKTAVVANEVDDVTAMLLRDVISGECTPEQFYEMMAIPLESVPGGKEALATWNARAATAPDPNFPPTCPPVTEAEYEKAHAPPPVTAIAATVTTPSTSANVVVPSAPIPGTGPMTLVSTRTVDNIVKELDVLTTQTPPHVPHVIGTHPEAQNFGISGSPACASVSAPPADTKVEHVTGGITPTPRTTGLTRALAAMETVTIPATVLGLTVPDPFLAPKDTSTRSLGSR